MNTRAHLRVPQVAAFTLIELLVVIAIICVLMGLLIPVIMSSKNSARRAEASTVVREIVASCANYQGDYGKYPSVPKALITGANGDDAYAYGDTGEGQCVINNDALFDILRSINRGVNNGYAMNRRQQVYIMTKVATGKGSPRNGFCDGNEFTSNQGQYLDPWGGEYCVVVSASASEPLDMSRFYSDLIGPQAVVRVSAAAFSMGVDGKRGEKGALGRLTKPDGSQTDDIVSWK